MAYDEITVAESDALSPIREPLWTKIRGNFIDQEARIAGLEGLTFSANNDHFDLTGAFLSPTKVNPGKWLDAGAGNIDLSVTEHIAVMAGSAGQDNRLRSNLRSFPLWLPKIHARLKFNAQANINELFVGLQLDRATTLGEGADGVYLVFPTAAAPFFRVKKGGSTTDSAVFTDPGDDTYFEVKIEYTSSNVVTCTIDAQTPKIFTGPGDNVPDGTENLFGEVHYQTDGTGTCSIDRIEHRNLLLADT